MSLAAILLAIIWFGSFFREIPIDVNISFSVGNKWVDLFLGMGLVIFQSIFLNRIINEHKLFAVNTYLPSLVLTLLNCVSFLYLSFYQIVLSNALLLLAFDQLLKLSGERSKLTLLFNASLLVGISSLIYFPNVLFFLFVWVVLIYINTPVWRDFVISIIGFILPLLYYVSYVYVFDDLSTLMLEINASRIYVGGLEDLSVMNKILMLLLAFIFLLGLSSFMKTSGKSVTKVKRMLAAVFIYLVFGAGTLFLNQGDVYATFLLMSIPLSIIMANFFQHLKKVFLAELIFAALVVVLSLSYFL